MYLKYFILRIKKFLIIIMNFNIIIYKAKVSTLVVKGVKSVAVAFSVIEPLVEAKTKSESL